MKRPLALCLLFLLAQPIWGGQKDSYEFVRLGHRQRMTHFKFSGIPLNRPACPQLTDNDGKVVVLIFWAPWCQPSLKEIETWVQLYDRYRKEGVEFIVLADEYRKKWSQAEMTKYVKDHHMDFPVVVSDVKTEIAMHPTWLPTVFFFDKSGRFAARYVDKKYEPELTMGRIIQDLLKENSWSHGD